MTTWRISSRDALPLPPRDHKTHSRQPRRLQTQIQRTAAGSLRVNSPRPRRQSETCVVKMPNQALRPRPIRPIQEQIDRLEQELAPTTPPPPPSVTFDLTDSPAPSQEIAFPPSQMPKMEQDETLTGTNRSIPCAPKRKLPFSSPHSTGAPPPQPSPVQRAQQAEASSATRPIATTAQLPMPKKHRQSRLTGEGLSKATALERVFDKPSEPSAWFTANYTGVHTDSGVARWFEDVLKQFPNITEEQHNQLDSNAVSHGIPVRTVAKFAVCPLLHLLAIITAMTE